MSEFNIHPALTGKGQHFGCLVVQPTIIERIREAQSKDGSLRKWFSIALIKALKEWKVGLDRGLRCRNRQYVPDVKNLRQDTLAEEHKSGLTMHPRGTRMYKDLK